MSRMPDDIESKYNHDNKFIWVDSQLEKFMLKVKELEGEIKQLKEENKNLKRYFNIDFDDGDVTDVEETYIYESPDGGKTVFRRPINNYDSENKVEVVNGKPTGRTFDTYNTDKWNENPNQLNILDD